MMKGKKRKEETMLLDAIEEKLMDEAQPPFSRSEYEGG